MRLPRLALVLVILSSAASAETFDDVRAALSHLHGKQPIRATYAIERVSATSGRFANDHGSSQITAEVARTTAGVLVTIPTALLDRAAEETQLHSGSFRNETRNAISNISLLSVADHLNYAPSLSGILQMGRVSDERREMRDGRPLRRLILEINQPMTKTEGIEVGEAKASEDRLTLWIGEDNVPLAAHRTRKIRAAFLFLHGDTSEEFNWTFARSGDSLVLVRFEESTSFSGMGQKGRGKSVTTLSVN